MNKDNFCKICGSNTKKFDQAVVLKKYSVNYFICEDCGFVSTEHPYWLEEAYSEAIYRTDTGIVRRNIRFSRLTRLILSTYFATNEAYVDYGGGYGLLVRLMRDAGFDFRWYDPHSQNLLSIGFEADLESDQFILATAFEVLEHLQNPIHDIQQIFKSAKNLLFSTILLPHPAPKPCEHWYYALEHGQHISFFTLNTLKAIADKMGLHLVSNGKNIHLLSSEKKISSVLFRVLSHPIVYNLLGQLTWRKSLILSDSDLLKK